MKDNENNSSVASDDIRLFCERSELHGLTSDIIEKRLHMCSGISVRNMHAFDSSGYLKLYDVGTILKEFYNVRLDMYSKRKSSLIN